MRKIPRIAKIGKIGVIRGYGRIKAPPPLVKGGAPRKADALPDSLRDVARRIGDKRAMKIWKLWQKGLLGTLPELCVYDGLESHKVTFDFQSAQMGGRRMLGGAVVDFILYDASPNGIYVIRIQGDYWHSRPQSIQKDKEQKTRLLRHRIGGAPIVKVIDMWESDIYNRWPEVLVLALIGEEFPHW